MENEILDVAMQIILNAGEARNDITKAMQFELIGEKENSELLIARAKENIKLAHLAQTKTIQDEARGKKIELCVLFVHAQDTLMTIASEVNMIEQMIKMYRKLEDRVNGNN